MVYRENTAFDRTPIQQSMTQDPHDYAHVFRNTKMVLGVVLEVYPSDQDEGNRSSRQSVERRGFTHEATVLVVNDGTSAYHRLYNVIITPDCVSGIDDYYERLPRGCSGLVTGEEMNTSLHQIDPYDLDGDWCVVGFIGGQLDQPFILRWWPHARNTFDPATSGEGNPDSNGEGQSLVQNRRYFRRVNGVETVVTSRGDIIVSTTFTGGEIQPGQPPHRGRFARSETEQGGNVKFYIKPSSVVEWSWDPQKDGIGVLDGTEPELPQPNPPSTVAAGERSNTYLYIDSERFIIRTPDIIELDSEDQVFIEGNNSVELESSEIKIGRNAIEPLVLGETLQQVLTDAIVQTAFGPATFSPETIANFPNFLSNKHKVE